VMAAVLAKLASEPGATLAAGEVDALGRSLPSWPVFPEVPEALAEARRRGWRPLTKSDRDLIDASLRACYLTGTPRSMVSGDRRRRRRRWEPRSPRESLGQHLESIREGRQTTRLTSA
jgi:hypothetical protein